MERLGGFWWYKGTAIIWNSETFLEKKRKNGLRYPFLPQSATLIFLFTVYLKHWHNPESLIIPSYVVSVASHSF